MMVLAILEESRNFYESTIQAVPPEEAQLRLTPGSWSILEIAEHVAIVERRLGERLASVKLSPTEPSASVPRDGMREAQVARHARSRMVKVQAPERAHPTGRCLSLSDVLEEFSAARKQLMAFAAAHQSELYDLTLTHPFFGLVNGVEMLHILAAHSGRHADQILEIRSGGLAS